MIRWTHAARPFPDPVEEAAFRQSWVREMVGPVRATTSVAVAAMLAFAAVDYLTLEEPSWDLFVRLGLLTPILLLVGLVTFHRRRDVLLVPVAAAGFAAVGALVSAYLYWLPVERAAVVQGGVVLVLIAGYACSRLPLSAAASAGWIASAGNGAFVLAVDLPRWQRTSFLLYLLVANALGFLLVVEHEATARRRFADRRRLARQRVRLIQANRDLRAASLRDPLTGLLNRRALEVRLQEAVAHAQRCRPAGTVVMVDLDGFKGVNDSLGHGAGDQLLKQVAAVLVGRLRGSDSAFRLGGDEFCIYFPDLDPEGAAHITERLLERLREETRVLAVPLGFSAGLSAVLSSDLSPDDVLARADGQLYRAKALGKGRVLWEASPVTTADARPRQRTLHLVR